MKNTDDMLNELELKTGIKLERDENKQVNMTKFTEDYKNRFPEEYRNRFGNATVDEVMALYFRANRI